MRILTVTDARRKLGYWLRLAAKGEDVGVIVGSDIVALRRVGVKAAGYAYREYRLTPSQVQKAGARMTASIRTERRAGTVTELKRDWRELRG
jgi:antitoxin (DNA-binding transcriptional repressor) of toxin-antitoxin stability system